MIIPLTLALSPLAPKADNEARKQKATRLDTIVVRLLFIRFASLLCEFGHQEFFLGVLHKCFLVNLQLRGLEQIGEMPDRDFFRNATMQNCAIPFKVHLGRIPCRLCIFLGFPTRLLQLGKLLGRSLKTGSKRVKRHSSQRAVEVVWLTGRQHRNRRDHE
jgi:hypothetical protein